MYKAQCAIYIVCFQMFYNSLENKDILLYDEDFVYPQICYVFCFCGGSIGF